MTQGVASLPFGTDLATVMMPDGSIDLDPGMSEVSGRGALIQRCLRRVTTPRGSVVDAPNDCIDIRGFVRAGVLASTPTNLQIQLQKEFAKEQGVIKCSAGVQYNQQTSTLRVAINLQSSYGPLLLTFLLSATNIAVLVDGLPVNFNPSAP